jgi:CDP-diacylglycerol--glycerol-3-phosphate 3-phosphatidyltransferase
MDSLPVLTLFGSTNLNSRSANLDTELSFVMATSSDDLRRELQEEIQGLHRWAVPWRGGERKVRWRTKAIVALVGGML